jgi:hypothetical protein
MKLAALSCGAIDWTALPTTMRSGETGAATMHSRSFGDIWLRRLFSRTAQRLTS